MVDRPIIFSAPMIRALLEGRKTQTRRILGLRSSVRRPNIFDGTWTDDYVLLEGNSSWRERCTPYAVGDRLYVREAFRGSRGYDGIPPAHWGNKPVWYVADGVPSWNWDFLSDHTRPSIHMPRWASRLTLTVTKVRVQRLQEISGLDVHEEGACQPAYFPLTEADDNMLRGIFRDLWNSLHGPDAWDENPWVVALTFTVQRGNIDQIGGAP